MELKHREELEDLREDHEEKVEALRKEHERKLKRLQDEKDEQERDFRMQLMEKNLTGEVLKNNERYDGSMRRMRARE